MVKPRAIRPISLEENFINFLCYGEPGVGKTPLAGTSPKCLMLVSDSDETTSAAVFGSKADKWVTPTYEELQKAVDYLHHGGGTDDYQWVWLDNGTLFQEQGLMDDIMPNTTTVKAGKQSALIPDRPQYLLSQNHFSSIVRQLKAMPIHFGLTAHVMDMVDIHNRTLYVPMLQGGQGSFSQKICGYMNVVGFMTVLHDQEETRRLWLGKKEGYIAKDRFNSTPKGFMDNPTIPKLMELAKKVNPKLGERSVSRKPGSSNGKVSKASKTTRLAKKG